MPDLNPDQFDYRMQHQPAESGEPMHAIKDTFPDIHKHPEYYHHGGRSYDESMSAIRMAKDKPEAQVTIYRSVPRHVTSINDGDWVTPSRQYAKQEGYLDNVPTKVLSMKVPAKHLRTEGNDVNEWGYFPDRER